MKQIKFSTNKRVIIFYALLSVVVLYPAWVNLYHLLFNVGSYTIGFKSLIGLILPILVFFSFKNNLIVFDENGFKVGKKHFGFKTSTFSFKQEALKLTDRPLYAPWQAKLTYLTIKNKVTSEVDVVELDMSQKNIELLKTHLLVKY